MASAIPDAASFRCLRVGTREIYVGSDQSQDLIALFPACSEARQFRVNEVEFLSRSNVTWVDTEARSETMGILKFRRNSPDDLATFASVVCSILNATDRDAEGKAYADVIDAWLSLLNSGRRPTFSEVLGLWGELLLITTARDVGRAISAWQWRDSDPSDFVYRGQAVEVKTTTAMHREHTTSLVQHRHGLLTPTVLVSIQTKEDPYGCSVEDLFNRIASSPILDAESSAKLVSAVARRLGFGFEYRGTRFSDAEAVSSRRAYRWEELPNLQWPSNVLSAQWTFVLADEAGVALGATTEGSPRIADIFS